MKCESPGSPQPQRHPHSGRFLEITRPRRIVFTWTSPHAGQDTRVTLDFAAAGERTLLTLTHERLPEAMVEAHRGGWTSHFEWGAGLEAVTLDVFGHALRESTPWEDGLIGLYAGPHTVAEMKRTSRDKDWAAVTALGVRMIEADDERGWLHIFNADTLAELLQAQACPSALAAARPALQLALARDPRAPGALNAERRFWEELDRRRIQLLEGHLRPYVAAVRQARAGQALSLREDHALRLECAARHLPPNPLKEYGLQRYVGEAKAALVEGALIPADALTWLPDVAIYFEWLNR